MPANKHHLNADEEPAGRMVNNHGHWEYRYDDEPEPPVPPLRIVPPTSPGDATPLDDAGAAALAAPHDESPECWRDPAAPAQLRARHDGWTAERQRTFLHALADTGSVARAAEAARITPRSAHRLRNHPKGAAFDRAWRAAQMTAAKRLIGVAFERATTGTSRQVWRQGQIVAVTLPPSDRVLMFLLKHLAPDLFGPHADPARRLSLIEALQADWGQALATLDDLDVDLDPHDPTRYPSPPTMERI